MDHGRDPFHSRTVLQKAFLVIPALSLRTRAEVLLFSVTFVWGSTFVITKSLLQEVSPFLYSAIRFSFASLIFGAFTFSRIRTMTRRALWQGMVLGLLLFVGFSLQTIGLQLTSASKSAFFTGMLVVFTPICQTVIERRAPKKGNIAGVVLVTLGLFLLTSPEGSSFNRGDALTLICGLLFALYIVYLDIFAKESDSEHLTVIQFFSSAILAGGACLLAEDVVWKPSPGLIGGLTYLTVFATVIALYVQTRFQKDTTPTRSAIIFSSEPVIAAGFAYVILGEVLGWAGVSGACVIVVGLLVSELSDQLFVDTANTISR